MDEGSIVVVGAGAAGLMAAIFACAGSRPVLVLEHTRDGGRKILISGGGRCNVLPSELDPARYFTDSSPHSLRRMLLSWPLREQRRFFEERLGLRLVLEEETGKLFPETNRARDVRDGLIRCAREAGADFRFSTTMTGLAPTGAGGWRLALESGDEIEAHRVVIATGGLSVANTGSDGRGLALLRRLGHTVNETYPALTPLTAEPAVHAHLAGISMSVQLEVPLQRGRFRTRGGFLFTHRGYSGPSILDVSHFAIRAGRAGSHQPILVQWTELDVEAWDARLRDGGGGEVGALLRRVLPQRLADTLVAERDIDPAQSLARLRRDDRAKLVEALARYPLPWTGDEGYRKAEVTGGGVALGEVDPRTLESRTHPGLFICGEALDAFGPIGGYNFAWAWATGRAAGLGAGSPSSP